MAFKKRHQKKFGFSLIELLIGISLLAIVSLVIGNTYVNFLKGSVYQSELTNLASQNKTATEEITFAIRQSRGIVTSASCQPGIQTNASNIVLELWPLDVSQKPFDPSGTNYDYIVYTLSSNQITKIVCPSVVSSRTAANHTITTNVSDANLYTYNLNGSQVAPTSANEVTINLTLQKTVITRSISNAQSRKVSLRNK